MYFTPHWRRGQRDASARARQVPVSAHVGSPTAFLRRHERDVSTAIQGNSRQREDLVRQLLPRIADPRNLFLAFEKLSNDGGQAPGPDGLHYGDLSKSEVFAWARAVRTAILDGSYRPGPERCIEIPKASGKGSRTIRLTSILDRVVGRAITQILQPVLDPLFLPTTIGYRPRRNTHDALALAELHAGRGLRAWICEDVRDAFNQIPQRRLLDVLRLHLPDDDLRRLLEVVIVTPSGRGVPQGGCLSPMLLNLYLHHHLDRPWARSHPNTVLIRVADDLLILTTDEGTALDLYDDLRKTLLAAGMPLKGTKETAVADLDRGQQVGWLGFNVSTQDGDLTFGITAKAWSRLETCLEEASTDSLFPVRIWDVVQGWINYLGPCYRREDVLSLHARIRSLIVNLGLEETPSLEEVTAWWSAAHARWGKRRLKEDHLPENVSLLTGKDDQGTRTKLTAPPVAPAPAETSEDSAESTADENGQGVAETQQIRVTSPAARPGLVTRRMRPEFAMVGNIAAAGHDPSTPTTFVPSRGGPTTGRPPRDGVGPSSQYVARDRHRTNGRPYTDRSFVPDARGPPS